MGEPSLIGESPMYSMGLLTEDGIFDVSPGGARCILKRHGKFALLETISVAVMYNFGTNPEAKAVEFSPSEEYVAFVDKISAADTYSTLDEENNREKLTDYKVISLLNVQSGVPHVVDLFHNTFSHHIWSSDSEFLISVTASRQYLNVFPMEHLTKDSPSTQMMFCGPANSELGEPLCAFSPDSGYFAVAKHNKLSIYSTKRWNDRVDVGCLETLGLLWLDKSKVAVWNKLGEFVIYLFSGHEHLHIKRSSDVVRSVALSDDGNILALATHNDQIEIYIVDPWKKDLTIDIKVSCTKFRPYSGDRNLARNSLHYKEPEEPLDFHDRQFVDRDFVRTNARVKLCPSIQEEEFLKGKRPFYLKFSSGARYLASTDPGIRNSVFIWNLKNASLKNVISLKYQGCIKELKWHPEEDILAVVGGDLVVFWTPSRCYAIHSSESVHKFSWVPLESMIMCAISFQRIGYFIYLKSPLRSNST